jgi:hypothetical protein
LVNSPQESRAKRSRSALVYLVLLVLVLATYLVGTLVFSVWQVAGSDGGIEDLFRGPSALLMVSLSGAGLYFSLRVWRAFEAGEAMRRAWQLITFSAAADLTASSFVQIFGTQLRLNPLRYFAEGDSLPALARSAGLMLGGTCRFAMLAVGLLLVIRIYRRAGFLGRFAPIDWAVLAAAGILIVREAVEVVSRVLHGTPFTAAEIFNLPVDPLLWVLLSQSLLLFRSVRQMGLGWIGKCYGAFAAGIVLVLLGDIAIWATNSGYLPWPWSALGWSVWIPAAGAFAIAPALQWEAMRSAEVSRPAE